MARLTLVVLVVAIGAIVAALFLESSRNPTFRAADHGSYEACVAAIPAAWPQGSIDWVQAEAACRYEHAAPNR